MFLECEITDSMNVLKLNTEFLISRFPQTEKIWVAYSGGLDSQVLLHLAATHLPDKWRSQLHAIHVHHGLSPNADLWAEHCQRVCQGLNIPLQIKHVEVSQQGSIENAARNARYCAFSQCLHLNDLLIQAHHANDQAETLLFRLERGTGLRGMGGIPAVRRLKEAYIWRPLLHYRRQQIEDYAKLHGLQWIEDESNTDFSYRRNFIRHLVISPWETKTPDTPNRIASSAEQMQQEWQVLERLVSDALDKYMMKDTSLLLSSLPTGEEGYWMNAYLLRHGISLTQPQTHALVGMFYSQTDKQPEYIGASYRLARFHNRLYILPPEQLPVFGELFSEQWFERPFDKIKASSDLRVGPRPNGAHLVLKNGMHKPLKKWLSDQHIPVWWREHLPYLYEGNTLVAIGDLWQHPDWSGKVEWERNKRLPL